MSDSFLLSAGINDHYVVRCDGKPRVARLYNLGKYWAPTSDELRFELEWLDFLAREDVPVAAPLRANDGDWLAAIQAPEGLRQLALFEMAEGKSQFPPNADNSRRLGRACARIHQVSARFMPSYPRISYDIGRLISQPIAAIGDFLASQPEFEAGALDQLRELGVRLTGVCARLGQASAAWGPVACDINGFNHNVDEHGELTLFDFDFCGLGWQVQDLATYLRSCLASGMSPEIWRAFFTAYEEIRPLSVVEKQVLPAMVSAVSVFMTRYYVSCAAWAGKGFLGDLLAGFAAALEPMEAAARDWCSR